MSFKRFIGKVGLKVGGWKTVFNVPADLGNAVCIVAPHTAIADFFVGMNFYWYHEVPFKFMIKSEFFKTRLVSWCFYKIGAVRVDRGKKNNLVEQMIEMFSQNKDTHLIICPEGTRKKVNQWKRGFYLIAEGAKVPILLGFIDYKKRYCGVEKVFYPTGDYEKDLAEIWDYYKSIKVMGKHPEQFNLYDLYEAE